MDKNEAIIDYLLTCPAIADSQLFFNFAKLSDNSKHIVTNATDVKTNREYIDGSVLKRYTFTILDYRSVSYQPVVHQKGFPNENVTELLDAQGLIDWVSEQNDIGNYPDFGEHCIVDEIRALSNVPALNGVDTQATPNIAKYSIIIQVLYLDKSKVLFK